MRTCAHACAETGKTWTRSSLIFANFERSSVAGAAVDCTGVRAGRPPSLSTRARKRVSAFGSGSICPLQRLR
jgi:hypothetical protein